MELNSSVPDISTNGVTLEEPHFDEVATVLSARPVVPLQEIQHDSRPSRRLMVGVVVLVALLIGAFGATLIYRLGRADAVAGSSMTDDTNAQPSSSLEAGTAGEAPAETPSEAPSAAQARNVAQPVSKSDQTSTPRIIVKPERQLARREDGIAEQRALDRDLRREQKREARRMRKAEKQAMRKDVERHSDDLFRIREIFEGSPRP